MFGKPVDAVLFDMDGLLIDTEAVYIKAHMAAARSMDVEMPLDFCHSMIGFPDSECFDMIQDFYGPAFRIDHFNARFYEHIQQALEVRVPLKAGVFEILDFLRERRLPLAVATSSVRKIVERYLGRARLLDRFRVIATHDDVERGKPHPDVYLEAARRLGVSPERCIAFEDSNAGLTAAHAAGTMAIMVPDIVQPLPEVRAKCFDVVDDLHAALRLLKAAL